MKAKKLVSAMAITLTAVFVALGAIACYAYVATKSVMAGGISGLPMKELIFNIVCPLLSALVGLVLVILGFIGASKAKNEVPAKGLFITISVFQMIFVVATLAESGWNLYMMFQGVTIAGLIELLMLEATLWVFPLLFAGIAVLIAFIKTCMGNSGSGEVQVVDKPAQPQQPQPQIQISNNPTPPPFPPRPPEFKN